MAKTFKPRRKYQSSPIRIRLENSWIGIGGKIVSNDGLREWPEATQAQYNQLGKEGRLNLVYAVDQPKEPTPIVEAGKAEAIKEPEPNDEEITEK